MDRSLPRLFLCAGLQCSGSTLISWCFLQRHDMDGVLDGEYDLLPRLSPNLGKPLTWCKTTISSFRLTELKSHYEDEGWSVSPLLIVRDIRDTWASLQVKPYGVNGFTAEDPPLRLRFRRFQRGLGSFSSQRLAHPALRESSGESREDPPRFMSAPGTPLGRLYAALDQRSQPDCRRESWKRLLPADARSQPR